MRNKMKGIALTVALSAISVASQAADQYIVKFKEGNSRSIISSLRGTDLFLGKQLVKESGLYTVKYPMALNARAVANNLQNLRANPAVEYAQLDHEVTFRGADRDLTGLSDDPLLNRLWSFKTYGENQGTSNAKQAWESYGVGGKNGYGDDIVVAVIDGGFDIQHRDLVDNIYVNAEEVPGNGVDDDNNGYVDDAYGWSVQAGNGTDIPSGRHGTHVAGIVGARGNNGFGVVGINWDVKIMPIQISMFGLKTSDIVEAYGYVIDAKRRYFLSRGTAGANIVSTNSSFGIDGADCTTGEYPVWNDLYEQMGELGILSAAATANRNWNIDEVGDVPTGCSSDYIVSVTNIQENGMKNRGAGYGATTIDLAAPGTQIYSTVPNDKFSSLTGTSMATPHVAGAIAYLYSVGGNNFNYYSQAEPGLTALAIKQALMEGVRATNELSDKTVSGGTLDLKSAADGIAMYQ